MNTIDFQRASLRKRVPFLPVKIDSRFSFRDRIPIFPVKSIIEFDLQTGSRLNTGYGTASADGM